VTGLALALVVPAAFLLVVASLQDDQRNVEPRRSLL
jgi:hypothetical protein